jgi:ribosomal-protein-alanine N-acetyltransferase
MGFTTIRKIMLSIRKMNLSDLSVIHEIESEVHAYPWTKGMFMDCLNNQSYEGVVLELEDEDKNNNELCAYLITQSILDECHILTIGVKKTRQKQGQAMRLLSFLIECQKEKYNRILLEVAESNIPAIHLYKKLGFQQIGVRKNYYQSTDGRPDNALIFEKLLGR